MKNHILAFESDLGSTKPYGFGFTGNAEATQIVQDIASKYFKGINCTHIKPNAGGGAGNKN